MIHSPPVAEPPLSPKLLCCNSLEILVHCLVVATRILTDIGTSARSGKESQPLTARTLSEKNKKMLQEQEGMPCQPNSGLEP